MIYHLYRPAGDGAICHPDVARGWIGLGVQRRCDPSIGRRTGYLQRPRFVGGERADFADERSPRPLRHIEVLALSRRLPSQSEARAMQVGEERVALRVIAFELDRVPPLWQFE